MKLHIIIILFSIFISTSCSSTEWVHAGVAPIKRTWRECTALRDGDKAGKGFCYIDKECKTKFIWYITCRNVPLFCAYTDTACKIKHRINEMRMKR